MEARRPEEAEARPEATKAFQYPLVARPELVEVTKAHPESEDPEVVHHPEMAEPEESEAHRPAFHHHRPAASLHHRRELLASREPVRVRPEMACCWGDPAALNPALHPELAW